MSLQIDLEDREICDRKSQSRHQTARHQTVRSSRLPPSTGLAFRLAPTHEAKAALYKIGTPVLD